MAHPWSHQHFFGASYVNSIRQRSARQATSSDGSLGPVRKSDRIESIDVLRGFALLGIIAVNIQTFALNSAQQSDLAFLADVPSTEWYSWLIVNAFFHAKMYPIFSMLFAAGLVFMDERAEQKGKSLTGIYYRRLGWLFAFGMCHAYLLWEGDILVIYALCGAMLFPFRRLSPRLLLAVGLIGYSLMPIGSMLGGQIFDGIRVSATVGSLVGEEATEWQRMSVEIWRSIETELATNAEKQALENQIYRGSYWELFKHRAPKVFSRHIAAVTILNFGFLGVMFCGVACAKGRVFDASRSLGFYITWMVAGYGIGLSLIGYVLQQYLANGFDYGTIMRFQGLQAIACALMVMGHIGMVMTVCKINALRFFTKRLAAAGRMALTNYLCQSLICGTIFFGWGLGHFGYRSRVELWGIVLAIWCLQLFVSPIWLAFFRFGPMEWLWRSLTYQKQQPMLLPRSAGD